MVNMKNTSRKHVTASSYTSAFDIKQFDRVQHPDGRVGTVQHEPGWAVCVLMDNEQKPELWQRGFVACNFVKLTTRKRYQ